MTPTKIAYEEKYDDGSGVEFAVRFDITETHSSGGQGVIEFECLGSVQFPADRVDWLIERLNAIKELELL